MKIELKKFGTTLTSRQLGKEAYAAFAPSLAQMNAQETIEVIFDGVNTFSPSWADEFLTPLHNTFGDRLFLQSNNNPSVRETVKLLEDIGHFVYQKKP